MKNAGLLYPVQMGGYLRGADTQFDRGEPQYPSCLSDEIEEVNIHEETQIELKKGRELAVKIVKHLTKMGNAEDATRSVLVNGIGYEVTMSAKRERMTHTSKEVITLREALQYFHAYHLKGIVRLTHAIAGAEAALALGEEEG